MMLGITERELMSRQMKNKIACGTRFSGFL